MIRTVLLALMMLVAAPAAAEVELSFHSREFGETFPHAFVSYRGTLSDGTVVPEGGFGFTAVTVSPAILFGSVHGKLERLSGTILTRGTNHFTVRLDDAAYARMLAVVADWDGRGGKSYNLNRANCIHFVMDIARAVGLRTDPDTRFVKRPHGFMEELEGLNPGVESAAISSPS